MPPVRRHQKTSEEPRSDRPDSCFCGKPSKVTLVKKDGPNKDKKFFTCGQGLYNKQDNQTYGGCKYFRMEDDPLVLCPDCDNTMSLYKGAISSARCLYPECPSRKEWEDRLEALSNFLDKDPVLSFTCHCGGRRMYTTQWPMVKVVCDKVKEGSCGYTAGIKVTDYDDKRNEVKDLLFLFSSDKEDHTKYCEFRKKRGN